MKKNKEKCKNCGVIRGLKDLVITKNGKYYCFSCWNLKHPRPANDELPIRILKDGTPAIILDQPEVKKQKRLEERLMYEEFSDDY
jgi:hypothetical protein